MHQVLCDKYTFNLMAASKQSEKWPLLKSNLDWLSKVHNLERSIATLVPYIAKWFQKQIKHRVAVQKQK